MESSKTRKISDKTKSITKQACQRCHARKRKCDGQSPCSNCFKASVECIFSSEPPRKRGPQRGEKKKLEQTLAEVATELVSYKRLVEDQNTIGAVLPVLRAQPFTPTAEILWFLDVYSASTCAFMATPVPNSIDWDSFAKRECSNTASNLILYSMLANTATSAGRLTLSKQFAEVARECAGLTFDRTELSCAVGLTLLGLYYLTTDQMERASYYSSLAGTMISHLQKQQKGDQSHYLAHLLLVNGIANAEAMPITEIEAQERKFLEFEQNVKLFGGADIHPFLSSIGIMGRLRASLTKATRLGTNPREVINIHEIENEVRCAQIRVAPALAPFGDRMVFEFVSMANAVLATAYAVLGYTEHAVELADPVLDLLISQQLVHVGSVLALQNITEVHARCKSPRLAQDLELMNKWTSDFPVTGMVMPHMLQVIAENVIEANNEHPLCLPVVADVDDCNFQAPHHRPHRHHLDYYPPSACVPGHTCIVGDCLSFDQPQEQDYTKQNTVERSLLEGQER